MIRCKLLEPGEKIPAGWIGAYTITIRYNVSPAKAYKVLQALPDEDKLRVIHQGERYPCIVGRAEAVDAAMKAIRPVGNPNFTDSDYQSRLASRRRRP